MSDVHHPQFARGRRRHRRDHAAGTRCRRLLGQHHGGRYSITDVPPERWDPALYFSADHTAPDKTYSKIGGWVREFPWDPIRWKLPIPPKVAASDGRRPALGDQRGACRHCSTPAGRTGTTDPDNVAVILGNAIGGEKHYQTNMRIELPEVLLGLAQAPSLVAALPEATACTHHRRDARGLPGPLPRDQRRHDARRAGQRHGRPRRQPVQLPRPQLHHRRGLCVGPGGAERRRRRPGRPPLRRRHHRRHRPQHGCGRRSSSSARSARSRPPARARSTPAPMAS